MAILFCYWRLARKLALSSTLKEPQGTIVACRVLRQTEKKEQKPCSPASFLCPKAQRGNAVRRNSGTPRIAPYGRKQRGKAMQPRLPLPARLPNPALKGTRVYALVFFPYTVRPRPLAQALGTVLHESALSQTIGLTKCIVQSVEKYWRMSRAS